MDTVKNETLDFPTVEKSHWFFGYFHRLSTVLMGQSSEQKVTETISSITRFFGWKCSETDKFLLSRMRIRILEVFATNSLLDKRELSASLLVCPKEVQAEFCGQTNARSFTVVNHQKRTLVKLSSKLQWKLCYHLWQQVSFAATSRCQHNWTRNTIFWQ